MSGSRIRRPQGDVYRVDVSAGLPPADRGAKSWWVAAGLRRRRLPAAGYRLPAARMAHTLPRIVLDPTTFLRLALDPVRLAVLGSAAIGPVDVESLAADLDEPPRRVLQAVGRLREAGLLDDRLELDREALRSVGEALPDMEPADPAVLEGPWSPDEAAVLATFFRGSRLVEIPSSRGKRRVVLERLAQAFEVGLRYPEREVNLRLQTFHPDYAALRRHLVDEGFLTRAEGVYWRTGGTL